jgi:hypothetical protein
MNLEEIEGMREDLKKLEEAREFNIKEALNSVSNVQARYNSLIKAKGIIYCTKNCSDIPIKINKLIQELTEYNS